VAQKIKNFFTKWRQVQQKIPLLEMTELHITPQMPEYPKIAHDVFMLLLDGKLRSRTETLKFLKPLAPPPPPPPPPPPKRGRAAKAAAAAPPQASIPPEKAKGEKAKGEKAKGKMGKGEAAVTIPVPPKAEAAKPAPGKAAKTAAQPSSKTAKKKLNKKR
jgi:tRNA nucleotidyltransferase (CCA-adding enzyme)